MNYDDIRKYQRGEKGGTLGKLDEDFYTDVQKYCRELERNKEYNQLANVLSIVETIRSKRLYKLFQLAIVHLYRHGNELNPDDLSRIYPNMIPSEVALFRGIVKELQIYDHYLTEECEYLKSNLE